MSSKSTQLSAHKTNLRYRCTQNQFTVQVNIKPIYITAVQKNRLECNLKFFVEKLSQIEKFFSISLLKFFNGSQDSLSFPKVL